MSYSRWSDGGTCDLKLIIAAFILLIAMIATVVFGQTCDECTREKPCGYSVSFDGCNRCSGKTWCVNGKWFTTGVYLCTELYCEKSYEIDPPRFNKPLQLEDLGLEGSR
jgi:hypothetical protein